MVRFKLNNGNLQDTPRLTDIEFIEDEIKQFLMSERRQEMINGEKYFHGKHDILRHKRQMIGNGGKLEEVDNLPNNRIVDNQYKKMVNQKTNYILGKPITIQAENAEYADRLTEIFNRTFARLLKNIGKDSYNCGIGWLFVYYSISGDLSFRRFKPYEIIPGWKDEEHTELDYAIRIYDIVEYEGKVANYEQKVEIYHACGISRLDFDGTRLILKSDEPYFTYRGKGYNWIKVPLIPFKTNDNEIPLLRNVKSLQDGLNLILSNFQNNMEEDTRNTILVVVNYDGENLGEFRKNLSTFGAVKVRSTDSGAGDVRSLKVEVNSENYRAIIDIFKKAIVENAMGYDAKCDLMGRSANQMNIRSMYSYIDLDANEMETEFQASLETLTEFIKFHTANFDKCSYENEKAEFIFNRDMLMNETDIINNIRQSVGILSNKTLIAQHPWVNDIQTELMRLKYN